MGARVPLTLRTMKRVAGVAGFLVLASCAFDSTGAGLDDAGARAPTDASPSADAPRPAVDATSTDAAVDCDAACPGTCVDGACIIDCGGDVDCSGDVECPPGFDCIVSCGAGECHGDVVCGEGVGRCSIGCGTGSCTGDVVCAADECAIDCLGAGSCTGDVDCRRGACAITCLSQACTGRVDCADSCRCDVYCIGFDNCTQGSDCPGQCDTGNDGCTSLPPVCNACGP